MIINATSVTIGIVIIAVAFYAGLHVIRHFALTIAPAANKYELVSGYAAGR